MILAFPCDPLDSRHPDPHFEQEYDDARMLGIGVTLVDHDLLVQGEINDATRRLPECGDMVYRGWMLTSEQYRHFQWGAAMRGATLRTNHEQYQTAHEITGWYSALADFTPFTAYTLDDSLEAFDRLCSYFPGTSAVLRDYVKSAKHDWEDACYIPNVHDHANAQKIAARFRELRGDDFVGGYVLRHFEHFVTPEIRTWWMNGESTLAGPHPDTPDEYADLALPEGLTKTIQAMGLPFITVDLVVREDGQVRVVEIGDGQVSDWPDDVPIQLVSALDGLLL